MIFFLFPSNGIKAETDHLSDRLSSQWMGFPLPTFHWEQNPSWVVLHARVLTVAPALYRLLEPKAQGPGVDKTSQDNLSFRAYLPPGIPAAPSSCAHSEFPLLWA